MVVGICILRFRIHDCRSLKAKRRVVKAIIQNVRNKFNASVAEVGYNDVYRQAEIGVTMAGSDHKVINAKLDKMINMVDDLGLAELMDTDMEIIHL